MRHRTLAVLLLVAAGLISLGQADCEGEFPQGATPAVSASPGAATNSVTITIQPNSTGLGPAAFGANPLTIPSGTMVTWINNDSTPHSIVSTANLWNSGPLNPGQSFSRTFVDLGSFNFYCGVHGATSESGTILVLAGQSTPVPTPTTGGLPTTPIPVPGPVGTSSPSTPTGF